ncbi:VOC family protein [Microvirga terrestris]|uniref:VOC family protein n=1 Tax=Microvirga terrestris TaxID=2791024 RepID=A0ABS0HPM1_9HYPH|nr:VOC family protein [Microvirga terrestris]MBF9195418.1 VOC family protein [Microvirga terrestris]
MTDVKLRVVRPTNRLEEVIRFYRDGLGFELIAAFDNQNVFSGRILGHPQAPWHLAFTYYRDLQAGRAPTQDNLLVFYLPDRAEWESAVERMRTNGYSSVTSFNPYWDRDGATFEDPDGYRIVLQNTAWVK